MRVIGVGGVLSGRELSGYHGTPLIWKIPRAPTKVGHIPKGTEIKYKPIQYEQETYLKREHYGVQFLVEENYRGSVLEAVQNFQNE